MWNIGDTPPAIEKIRKPQWTAENTAKTQKAVNRLHVGAKALEMVFGGNCPAVYDMRQAIDRFVQLDPGVKVPE